MAENPSWPDGSSGVKTWHYGWEEGEVPYSVPRSQPVPVLPASVLQQAVEVFEQRAKQDRHDNEREAYMNAADYLRNLLSDEGSGPEVGRCMACGQFIKGGGVMCGECGRDEDRKNVGL